MTQPIDSMDMAAPVMDRLPRQAAGVARELKSMFTDTADDFDRALEASLAGRVGSFKAASGVFSGFHSVEENIRGELEGLAKLKPTVQVGYHELMRRYDATDNDLNAHQIKEAMTRISSGEPLVRIKDTHNRIDAVMIGLRGPAAEDSQAVGEGPIFFAEIVSGAFSDPGYTPEKSYYYGGINIHVAPNARPIEPEMPPAA